jgi:hypothetical protein
VNQSDPNRPPRSSGEKVNRTIEDATRRLEEETAKFITYMNNQVIPEIREHSSRGLREASKKLVEFADYLDRTQKR